MSKQEKKQGPENTQKVAAKEAPAAPSACKTDGCKHKPSQFGFCKDHYEMYMAGVIRGDGQKPIDYDQKLAQFLGNKQRKAA